LRTEWRQATGKRFPKDGPQTNNQFAAAAGQLALESFFLDRGRATVACFVNLLGPAGGRCRWRPPAGVGSVPPPGRLTVMFPGSLSPAIVVAVSARDGTKAGPTDRAAGDFDSAHSSTSPAAAGNSGRSAVTGGTGSFSWANMIAIVPGRWNGGAPGQQGERHAFFAPLADQSGGQVLEHGGGLASGLAG
jgi:hypothetical protein